MWTRRCCCRGWTPTPGRMATPWTKPFRWGGKDGIFLHFLEQIVFDRGTSMLSVYQVWSNKYRIKDFEQFILLITKMFKRKTKYICLRTAPCWDRQTRWQQQQRWNKSASFLKLHFFKYLLSSSRSTKAVIIFKSCFTTVSDSRQGPPFVALITSQTSNHCFSNNLLFYKGLINIFHPRIGYGYIHVYLFQVVVRNSWYDLELVLFPTDVTNHYSGFPITRLTYSDLGHFQACSVLIHILDLPKWASYERLIISMITGVVLTFGPAMVVEAQIM